MTKPMKTPHPFVLLSFLLFAINATKPSTAIADQLASSQPVIDTDGNKLRVGSEYHILPVFRGRGGGLTMGSSTGTKTCPLDVIQDRLEVSKGVPVKFKPAAKSENGVIGVSTDLNIKFSAAKTSCVQSNVWRLLKSTNSKKQWSVTTDGVEGNPGFDTTANWFKIEKFDDGYNLAFCPRVCRCGVLCRNISIYYEDNGTRSLALNGDVPFKVQFKKVFKSQPNQ